MASTYSPNLRLELIGTGEQQGTWGATTNTNLGTLLEEAIGGYTSVTVADAGDTTLTTANGAADQSRNMTINLTGTLTASRNVIVPAIEKVYLVKNATSGGFAVTVKVSGQTGVSVANGTTMLVFVDGTDVRQAGAQVGASNSLVLAAGSASAPSLTTTGDTNTGFYFPAADTISASTGGTERMRIDNSGNVGIGGAPSYALDVKATTGQVSVASTTGTNYARYLVQNTGGTMQLGIDNSTGTNFGSGAAYSRAIFSDGAYPICVYTNGTERMRIDASGNVLVTGSGGLGYGTGSGGAVTQATSKSTAVTLNKTNGQITMNNEALGAGAPVVFSVNNSTVSSTDTIILTMANSGSGAQNYYYFVGGVGAGIFSIHVRNASSGSLSDAVVLNFSVIKAVTS